MNTRLLLTATALLALANVARAQGTAFTYQGRLHDGANPAVGTYDLRFTIYDSDSAGSVVGAPITNSPTEVTNGLFTVTLDFGFGVFNGGPRWLEIGVRPSGGGAFNLLAPRQQITAAPYAVRSLQVADGAITAQSLADGSVTAGKLAPGAVSQLGGPGGAPPSAVQVDTNGLVGIGTAAPQAGLHITSGAALPTLEVLFQVQNGTGAFTNLAFTAQVAVQGTLAVIAAEFSSAVTLVSLTNPASPQILSQVWDGSGSFTNLYAASDVAWSGSNFVVAARFDSAVTIISATNPASLARLAVLRDGVGGFNALEGANSVAVSGNLLAIGSETDDSVTLVDISNPAAPVFRSVMTDGLGGFNELNGVADVALSESLLAIAALEDSAVTLVDVSNPASPVLRAVLRDGLAGYDALAGVAGLAFSGNLLGIAASVDNAVTLVNVGNPAAPVKVAELHDDGRDIALDGARSLAFSGNRLAVAASTRNAVTLFDVGAPSNPKLLSRATDGFAGVDKLRFPRGLAFFGADLAVCSQWDSTFNVLRLTEERAGLITTNWVGIGTSHPVAPLHVAGNFVVEDAEFITLDGRTIALGRGAEAITLDARTIALGEGAAATGNGAIAIGSGASASGTAAIALGQVADARGFASVAVGQLAQASHDYSIVFSAGAGFVSDTAPNQFIIGAPGGVGINVNNPQGAALMVDGDVRLGSDGQLFAPGGGENLRVVRGVISAAGAILHGQGFTVTRTAAGSYTVTFTAAFAAFPTVTVSAQSGVARIATITNVATSQAQVRTFDAAGTLVDTQFHFIAAGPR